MERLWKCEGYTGCWTCLNKPELNKIMSHYVWICLNNAEYDWICWHIPGKTVLNMLEFWLSNVVHSIRSLYKLLSSYLDKDLFKYKYPIKYLEYFILTNFEVIILSTLKELRNGILCIILMWSLICSGRV